MKRWFVLVALATAFWWPSMMVFAESADDQYVGIYNLIQQGDAFDSNGQWASALAKYTQAEAELKEFSAQHPDWYGNVVTYRLSYLAGRIAAVSARIPPAPVTPPPPLPKPAASNEAAAAPRFSAPVIDANSNALAEAQTTIQNLQEQLRQAEGQMTVLQAKLREALAAQPASVDPDEIIRAHEQMREMEKANALLAVSLAEARAAQIQTNSAENEQTVRELAEAKRKVQELSELTAGLKAENAQLAGKGATNVAPNAQTQALREENEVLKRQVAELKSNVPIPGDAATRKLQEAQAQIAALESDRDILRLEKIALEQRVKQIAGQSTATNAPVPLDTATQERVKQLEAERDQLQRKLDAALAELASGKSAKNASETAQQTSQELASLRARLDVLEALRIPYSADELALINQPQTTTLFAAVHSSKRAPNELPAAATALLSEAKRDVANHNLAEAESKYLEILKMDDRNPATLADLASIQVDLGHTAEAEKHVTAALAAQPNNEYCLFVMGRVRFQQAKYDDAYEVLSRAGKLNPDNAEIQNYLGITLSEKGLRGPAEAALRKAVQIDPGFGSAHANLAFVYLTQVPPLTELARWHYEKALAAGTAHNPEIEKLLNPPAATTNSPASP